MAEIAKYPQSGFPVFYADGVLSLAQAPGLVKFYLFRSEPSFAADGTSENVPFAEVVMPSYAFAVMATFFQATVRDMLRDKRVEPEALQSVRAAFNLGPP